MRKLSSAVFLLVALLCLFAFSETSFASEDCKSPSYLCRDGITCIDKSYVCNNVTDCPNRDDETDCGK